MVGGISSTSEQLEMMQLMRQQLQKADTDGTKGLSKDELNALSEQLKSNGKDQTSFIDKLQKNFDKIDKNGDGQISKGEFHSALKAENGVHGAKSQKAGGGGGAQTPTEDSSSDEETVYVQEGEDDSPITTDENGNIIFRTVIKLGGTGSGSSELTPSLNSSLLNTTSNEVNSKQGLLDYVSKQYDAIFGSNENTESFAV